AFAGGTISFAWRRPDAAARSSRRRCTMDASAPPRSPMRRNSNQLPTSNVQLPTSNFQLPTPNSQLPTSKAPTPKAESLFPVHREREQHVARHEADRAVARVDEDHAAGDGGPRTVDRAAARRDVIDRVVLVDRIHVEQHLAVAAVVRSEVTIETSGEDD